MAANTRDIRRRIKSVKNTSQITKAMQMVAAAKMRKAQNAAVAGRSYADLLRKVFASLADKQEEGAHPLLEQREVKKELYKQGFAVAGRPLPLGQSIGGSPDGTKSAAQ